ncbi:pyridoxamine 5'-phosphate oxidase family protein [Jiangella asiatica]|uniref:Pyridoxamine 5'-phosphate oxidase family protein n=1 Tax=Jiangella asiatica TaxID=2530372 RepID=A0A4V2Z2C5_9ACTN|nr:pyridoxamine 5'-phosphate oxidase family protein [Jiangella asiatica]TDE08318.1 pyridoxamine 5'-phosphate oxidase family protein [Jiangella asiatica]
MVAWSQFVAEAPHVAETFVRRHRATGSLCMLATLRSDGFPRISPVEPRIFEGRLVIVGMPGTLKFKDLGRDPRFSLHTATVDPYVGDGDAKVWGEAVNEQDTGLHDRFAEHLFAETGMDLRGQPFDPFYVGDLVGASSVEFADGQLTVTIWKPGEGERAVSKS